MRKVAYIKTFDIMKNQRSKRQTVFHPKFSFHHSRSTFIIMGFLFFANVSRISLRLHLLSRSIKVPE